MIAPALTKVALRARQPGGGTPPMAKWYLKSETGRLQDVLLGPSENFRWLGAENAQWSSLTRDTLRRGRRFDQQLAMRQHREMVDAYVDAGVTCHFLPIDEQMAYQVYARDSSFMTPYRRRGLPTRQSPSSRRVRIGVALLPRPRHSDL